MSDLISRQAAIDATTETVFVEYEDGDPRKEESIILQTKAAIRDRIKALPPVYVPDMNDGNMEPVDVSKTETGRCWLERNKDRILQAGLEGREVEFRIGGRLFAIREKAQ